MGATTDVATLVSAPLTDEDGAPVPQTHQEHLQKWTARAEAIPEQETAVPNGEGSLAAANAKVIGENLAAHGAQLDAMTHVDKELVRGIHSIALAYLYVTAVWRGTQPEGKPGLPARLQAVRRDRMLALCLVRAANAKGLVDDKVLREIEEGTGAIDSALDVAALGVVLRRDAPAALVPGGLLTEAELLAAERRAAAVAAELRPGTAPRLRGTDAQVQAVTLLRNRVWTLLLRAHEQCELAAANLVGVRRVRELVPGLLARRAAKKPPA